jgi:hypothetical protein
MRWLETTVFDRSAHAIASLFDSGVWETNEGELMEA